MARLIPLLAGGLVVYLATFAARQALMHAELAAMAEIRSTPTTH
jgi:hypothetical protein